MNVRVILVIRKYPDWRYSRSQMMGGHKITKESKNISTVTKHLAQEGVATFYMNEVIQAIKQGHLQFWEKLPHLSQKEIEQFCEEAGNNKIELQQIQNKGSYFRPKRFFQYITEKDPFRRLALSRSIGSVPIKFFHSIPVLKNRIGNDQAESILNNAKIKINSLDK